jgi:hypothetical protein
LDIRKGVILIVNDEELEKYIEDVGKSLHKVGIELRAEDGNCKSWYSLFEEIADKWNDAKDEEETVIGENIRNEFHKGDDEMELADTFLYTAKSISGKEVTGFLWVDRPWYCSEDRHTFYIRVQHYNGNYGATHFEDVAIDPSTIKNYKNEVQKRFKEPQHHLKINDEVICDIGGKTYKTHVNLHGYQGMQSLQLGNDAFFGEGIKVE